MTTVDLAAAQNTQNTETTTPPADDQACPAHLDGTRRRTALLGIAVAAGAVCAGCSSSKSSGASAAPSTAAGGGTSAAAGGGTGTSSAASSGADTGSSSSSTSSGAAAPLAATSAVPVGGGTILTDQKIVLTQPTAGAFKAFTAICTHMGCVVGTVQNGLIVCPCHGSSYHITDGSVANGPAPKPLAEIAIKVAGGEITQA